MRAGGVLAPNGRIYGIPALSPSILEIDVEEGKVITFGMLSNKGTFSDKWNGGVLAPNGRIYGIPWVGAETPCQQTAYPPPAPRPTFKPSHQPPLCLRLVR